MFYHYKFWHSLTHPVTFTQALEGGEIRGYKKKIISCVSTLYPTIRHKRVLGYGDRKLNNVICNE